MVHTKKTTKMNTLKKTKPKKLKYDVLSDIEHVLARSDTYGGSLNEETWKININGSVYNATQ